MVTTFYVEAAAVKSQSAIRKSVPLPLSFVPTARDVLCGKGKECYVHPGNEYFRKIVSSSLQRYALAKTKHDKGLIVMAIVDTVRQRSPLGGFVRFDANTMSWYEIGDEAAREKAGQTIRDALIELDPSKKREKLLKRAASKARRRLAKNIMANKQPQSQQSRCSLVAGTASNITTASLA